METTLIRACESIAVLMAILTLGAGLGAFAGHYALPVGRRKGNTKVKANDRLHDDYGIRGSYTPEANKLPPPPPVNLHQEIARAILQDRSARSRKGWQTRRAERQRQKDADILAMIEWGKREAGEV